MHKSIGFIDYFLDEWHANNYPAWLKEASNGEITVDYAYGKINSPLGGRTTDQWCSDMGVQKCDTIEELIEKIPDYKRGYFVHEIQPNEYEDFGPVVLFRESFEKAWGNALDFIKSLR